jgi:pSer/pThr/pTyr-binding forkhead associated (FHA) protein
MPRVIITAPDQTPQPYRFQLDRQAVQMGRGSENDIAINCGSVSVHHAVMERIEGGYQIRDLDSTNGTKLDGTRMPIIPLRDGLSVKLGDVSFDFSLTSEEKQALAREKPPLESPIIAEDPNTVAPKKVARPPARQLQPQFQTTSSAQSFMMMVVFLVLAALAFWIGLSMRHQKDTHSSLMKDMSNKGKAAESATPAEGTDTTAVTPAAPVAPPTP